LTASGRSQRGQVLVFIAVVLPLALLPLAAYAIDVAALATASSRLQAATAEAAMLAAQQIDFAAFRSGGALTIEERAARRSAVELLSTEAPAAVIGAFTIDGSHLVLETSDAIVLPFDFVPDRSIVIRARAEARLADGYDRPSSRLPLPTNTF